MERHPDASDGKCATELATTEGKDGLPDFVQNGKVRALYPMAQLPDT